MTKKRYKVIIHKSEYGYDARVPSLPGCNSQGETESEVLENIQDAITTYRYLDMDKSLPYTSFS